MPRRPRPTQVFLSTALVSLTAGLFLLPFSGLTAIPFQAAPYPMNDTGPPQLQSLRFSPSSVDTSSSPAQVLVTLDVTDDLSGIDTFPSFLRVDFESPTGGLRQQVYGAAFTRTGGDPLAGTWEGTLTLPRFSEAGSWVVDLVLVRDQAGNELLLDAAAVRTSLPSSSIELGVTSAGDDRQATGPSSSTQRHAD